MLAADAATLSSLAWRGRIADVHADRWIARANATALPAGLGLAAGWSAESLGEGFFSISTPAAGMADVLGWAASNPAIAYVEPDFAIAPTALPADPLFGSLWGLHNTGRSGGVVDADIDAPAAWDVTTGSRGVVVAVIDSGVDHGHHDLAANIWRNPGEIAGDGLDNDGNGFVDDVHGWDFANGDADPMDDNGHGTHVAGTIGAVGDNGVGVAGVTWQVSIMALKFLSSTGSGSTSGAVAAINYATRMKRDFGVNVVVTNNSWGGSGFSAALRDAIVAGGRHNILFVAASGNQGVNNDTTPHYPSNYGDSAVISVAASDRSNRLASFSNYGSTSVDLAAPGVAISSTTPGNAYASYSGTSMATPHVSGVVALVAAANPAATAAEIREAILSTTTPVPAFAGKMVTGGLLNAAAAVAAIRLTTPIEPPPPSDPAPVDPPPTDPDPEAPLPPPEPVAVDIVDVTPDPRTTAVESITVSFSRGVTGFDLTDLVLVRGDTAVSLADAVLASDDGLTWVLSGIAAATGIEGSYTLSLTAADSGITAADGGALTGDASDTWVIEVPRLPDVGGTLQDALRVPAATGSLRLSGIVGDGPSGGRDVDMYRLHLLAGQSLVIDVDARSLPSASSLDSFIRVFDARGRQVASNDDYGGSRDSRLVVRARNNMWVCVGVSGYGNSRYDPRRTGSGRNGSTGGYQLELTFGALPARGRSDAIQMLGFTDSETRAGRRQAAAAAIGRLLFAALAEQR